MAYATGATIRHGTFPPCPPPTAVHTGDIPHSPLAVTLSAAGDIDSLESEWRAIEQSDRISFFQTWDWVGSLLETLPADALPLVLRVQSEGRVVALGLLARGSAERRGVIRTRTLHLNETGVPDYDCITVEYNGLVTQTGFEQAAVDATVAFLSRQDDWDELYLDGLSTRDLACWSQAASATGLWSVVRWEKPMYCIDLDGIRGTGGSYMESLSPNTRYQIRRARKLYAARGELLLKRATSLDQAREWLERLVALHQPYWRAKGQPGAFATDHVCRFHAALMRKGHPRGAVEVCEVTAGGDPLGYLYNFRKGRTLYNYQSGFVYDQDPKLKPGLVCHALAAEDALRRGLGRYDLLAGGGHYKESLTNSSGTMAWIVLQKKRLLIGIENGLRRARTRWHAYAHTASGPPHEAQVAAKPGPLPRDETAER